MPAHVRAHTADLPACGRLSEGRLSPRRSLPQLWVCRFFLLQTMLGALRHSLLNLSHPKDCPGLWLQPEPPLWDLPIREVRSGGCHAVSSTRTLGNLGARMGGTTRPTPWSVATARPREVQRLVPAHTAHGRQVKVSNPVQLLGPRCF